MSRTDDIIDKTKRKEPEAKKWKVVVGIVVGLVLAGGMFGLLFWFADVDEYLSDTKQIYRLYDFYDLNIGKDETAVYFIGSSIIGDAVHCEYIDSILENSGYNISTYNLLMDSDMPLRRLSHLENIIESSPSLIIYGVTYRSTLDNEWRDETVVLVHDRLIINTSSLYLYSEDELSDLNETPTISFKKRFLKSSLTPHAREWAYDGLSYAKDPFIINQNDRRKQNISLSEIQNQAENPLDVWRPIVSSQLTRNEEALIYSVKRFEEAGIPVVIINTPLHPLFSEKVTDESRSYFSDWLNSTGASWYDLETIFDETYFRDSHHATYDGGILFSELMAEIIIQEII